MIAKTFMFFALLHFFHVVADIPMLKQRNADIMMNASLSCVMS